MNEPTRAKVLFRVPDGEGGENVETLWAERIGEDVYALQNLPFFAYSVSWEDHVYAPFDESEGFPTFRSVMRKSGNRTIRIIFDVPLEDGSESEALLEPLLAMGCSYEGATGKYVCLNIPPGVDLFAVADALASHEITFEYADPTYGDIFEKDRRTEPSHRRLFRRRRRGPGDPSR